jgi:hypothetical protein
MTDVLSPISRMPPPSAVTEKDPPMTQFSPVSKMSSEVELVEQTATGRDETMVLLKSQMAFMLESMEAMTMKIKRLENENLPRIDAKVTRVYTSGVYNRRKAVTFGGSMVSRSWTRRPQESPTGDRAATFGGSMMARSGTGRPWSLQQAIGPQRLAAAWWRDHGRADRRSL